MTHNEKRYSALREGQIALFTGAFYGCVHTLSGHPLDTIKSKLQLQSQFSTSSAWNVAINIYRSSGMLGFMRGCIPPLWGSVVYRSLMMSTYEMCFSYIDLHFPKSHFLKQEYCYIRPMAIVSVVFCSLARCLVEAPVEYAKLMRQTERSWSLRHIYRGLPWQCMRTTALLLPVFTTFDALRQHTSLMTTLSGNFAITALVVGTSYILCWPLETLKNLAQAGVPHAGASVQMRISHLGGLSGLFRGVWPGAIGGGLRNACGMVAMIYAQQWATKLGLRE